MKEDQMRDQAERLEDLEKLVAYLRAQLDRERGTRTEECRQRDTIIAQLSAVNAEQARTIRQIVLREDEKPKAPSMVFSRAGHMKRDVASYSHRFMKVLPT